MLLACRLPDSGTDNGKATLFKEAISNLGPARFVSRAVGLLLGVSVLLEASFNIAWDYLQRTNALQDDAARFLTDEIERLIRKGHKNRMFLANIAIIKYQESSNKVVPIRD